jgi:oligoribonuclease
VFIWTDLETTGLDPEADEILAVGLIVTDDSFTEIARLERFVHVPAGWKAMRDMSPFVLNMHTQSGLIERVADSRLELAGVEREACAFLDQHLGEPAEKITARPVMAGNSVHFDRSFLSRHCPELLRRFNYRLLDVSTLKVLACATVPGAQAWNDSREPARHTPIADLEGSIAELAHWRQVLAVLHRAPQAQARVDEALTMLRDVKAERDAARADAERLRAALASTPAAKREWHGCTDPKGHTFDEGACHCGLNLDDSTPALRDADYLAKLEGDAVAIALNAQERDHERMKRAENELETVRAERDAARADAERLRVALDAVVSQCRLECSQDSYCGICGIALAALPAAPAVAVDLVPGAEVMRVAPVTP